MADQVPVSYVRNPYCDVNVLLLSINSKEYNARMFKFCRETGALRFVRVDVTRVNDRQEDDTQEDYIQAKETRTVTLVAHRNSTGH